MFHTRSLHDRPYGPAPSTARFADQKRRFRGGRAPARAHARVHTPRVSRPAAARANARNGVVAVLVDRAKGFVAEKIAQIPKPEAKLESISFKGISRESITMHSNVKVNNPYEHRIPICELTYTFKSAGKVIASGTMPDPGWIAASGTTKLELPVKVPYDFIVSLIKDLGGDWDIDYVLEVGITIDLPVVGSFTIPLTTEGEMKLPTFRDLF
ncbi:hypothetical protein E2562_006384 [Oryza meyeriana var. granulata]|uniref:Water stress and hypersensitive response domain-containing protein n=1 Tax=Oryza meyeriana var. granulata TaxID=110450 RepID=A0A6G1EFX8_9ORYZ|nr:hypothetical protein E2562_006384 [Oryza meyeriana var. granulata]